MLPIKCPTCGHTLGHIEIPFEEGRKKIQDNKDLTDEQKNEEIYKLLNKLKIQRYCCRMRVITYVDLAKIIV
tara:strand:- start:432 stop:647 length:216 start_codon:yes stop_codon:yes gene_type:complete